MGQQKTKGNIEMLNHWERRKQDVVKKIVNYFN